MPLSFPTFSTSFSTMSKPVRFFSLGAVSLSSVCLLSVDGMTTSSNPSSARSSDSEWAIEGAEAEVEVPEETDAEKVSAGVSNGEEIVSGGEEVKGEDESLEDFHDAWEFVEQEGLTSKDVLEETPRDDEKDEEHSAQQTSSLPASPSEDFDIDKLSTVPSATSPVLSEKDVSGDVDNDVADEDKDEEQLDAEKLAHEAEAELFAALVNSGDDDDLKEYMKARKDLASLLLAASMGDGMGISGSGVSWSLGTGLNKDGADGGKEIKDNADGDGAVKGVGIKDIRGTFKGGKMMPSELNGNFLNTAPTPDTLTPASSIPSTPDTRSATPMTSANVTPMATLAIPSPTLSSSSLPDDFELPEGAEEREVLLSSGAANHDNDVHSFKLVCCGTPLLSCCAHDPNIFYTRCNQELMSGSSDDETGFLLDHMSDMEMGAPGGSFSSSSSSSSKTKTKRSFDGSTTEQAPKTQEMTMSTGGAILHGFKELIGQSPPLQNMMEATGDSFVRTNDGLRNCGAPCYFDAENMALTFDATPNCKACGQCVFRALAEVRRGGFMARRSNRVMENDDDLVLTPAGIISSDRDRSLEEGNFDSSHSSSSSHTLPGGYPTNSRSGSLSGSLPFLPEGCDRCRDLSLKLEHVKSDCHACCSALIMDQQWVGDSVRACCGPFLYDVTSMATVGRSPSSSPSSRGNGNGNGSNAFRGSSTKVAQQERGTNGNGAGAALDDIESGGFMMAPGVVIGMPVASGSYAPGVGAGGAGSMGGGKGIMPANKAGTTKKLTLSKRDVESNPYKID